MNDVQVLQQARDLLAQPGVWITGRLAANAQGQQCSVDNPDACKFCAHGAVSRTMGKQTRSDDRIRLLQALDDAIGEGDCSSIESFNDAQTDVAPVLAVFGRAISTLQGAES